MIDNTSRNGGTQLQIDAAYADLRSAILRCVLPPSAVVTELQLAKQFGFGRSAVRSALTRLTHDGLVDVLPRRGYGIAPVTVKQVVDLYGLRLITEPAAARLAAEVISTGILTELEDLNLACAVTPGQADLITPRDANKAFHALVGRASGNDRLAALSATLMDELDRVLYLPNLAPLWTRLETTFDDHARLLAALRNRDARAAEQAAYDHVLSNRQSTIEAVIAAPGLGSINLLTMGG